MYGDACGPVCGWCGMCSAHPSFNAVCSFCGRQFNIERDGIGSLCDDCCATRDREQKRTLARRPESPR